MSINIYNIILLFYLQRLFQLLMI